MTSSSEQIQEYYQISSILNKRTNQATGQSEYLVKWKGWKKPTWEPQSYLSEVPDLIYQFEKTFKQSANRTEGQPRTNRAVANTESQSTNEKKAKKYNRLKKMNTKLNQDKQDLAVSSSSSLSSSYNGKVNEEPAPRTSKRRAEANKNQKSVTKGGRFKQTQRFVDESEEVKTGDQCHIGCVYVDQVGKVLNIEKREGKWMVQVKFQSQKLQNVWIQRDLIRLLYPLELLLFYQKDARAKGITNE